MVHAGLEAWQKLHQVFIPPQTIEEVTPTQDCLRQALELVWGYSQHYPKEYWPLILCEEPLIFTLAWPTCTGCGPSRRCMHDCGGNQMDHNTGLFGLAKIDAYFYVPQPTEIETGLLGSTMTLSKGWWIHEYKTKSPDLPIGLFMQKWEVNMQASFQILALQAKLQNETVQGVLVNVLEKTKRYIPQRKCKQCERSYEFSSWISVEEGSACPVCRNVQKLGPLKNDSKIQSPSYYRIAVSRTRPQIEKALQDIQVVGERMERMRRLGVETEPWYFENCTEYKRACPYFKNHLYNISTKEDITMQDIPEYRGIREEEV